jgi:four helix bundle protein
MLAHERLEAWKVCHELWIAVFQSTARWPVTERYVLASQLKRASLSAPANIAEGAAKFGPREYARHLNIAIGSLAEAAYLLRAAKDVNLIPQGEFDRLFTIQQRGSYLTMRLYRAVREAAIRKP